MKLGLNYILSLTFRSSFMSIFQQFVYNIFQILIDFKRLAKFASDFKIESYL